MLLGADAATAHLKQRAATGPQRFARLCRDLSSLPYIAGCSRPADQRAIPIADIARVTKLTDDGVEFLLMKALSLHLIEGSIDQVAGTVQVGIEGHSRRLHSMLRASWDDCAVLGRKRSCRVVGWSVDTAC